MNTNEIMKINKNLKKSSNFFNTNYYFMLNLHVKGVMKFAFCVLNSTEITKNTLKSGLQSDNPDLNSDQVTQKGQT